MLNSVRLALRIVTTAFDSELTELINAALLDLGIAGVNAYTVTTTDALITRAVITYCKLNFGNPTEKDYDRLKASYDEQKAQLSTSSDYSDME